jgi:hypothetical protein
MKTKSPIAKTTCPNTLAGCLRPACAARLLLLLLLTLPSAVQAQFTFTTNNGSITITGYTGSGATVTIPDTIDGLPATSIGDSAFSYCSNLTSVTIPNSVTNIGSAAFHSCTSLRGVYFLGNAPSVSSSVFDGADNTTIYYLPGTTGWGTPFGGRPTVLLPYTYTTDNGTITIWGYTGSVGAVEIPSTTNGLPVTSIGAWAFSECYNLTSKGEL